MTRKRLTDKLVYEITEPELTDIVTKTRAIRIAIKLDSDALDEKNAILENKGVFYCHACEYIYEIVEKNEKGYCKTCSSEYRLRKDAGIDFLIPPPWTIPGLLNED